MIRNLRAFFLGRLLREKLLLLAFVGIGVLWWAAGFSSRAGAFWRAQRATSLELADQRQWLARESVIEADAKKAASRLDSARTRNLSQLLADVSTLANEAGLKNTNTTAQRSVTSGQFSVHTVQLNANNVDWDVLTKKFYPALEAKVPYIGIEQFILAPAANRTHALVMRISSVEVAR